MNSLLDFGSKALGAAILVIVILWSLNKLVDLSFNNGHLTATIEFKDSLKELETTMRVETARIVKDATDERDVKIAERDAEVKGLIDARNADREQSLRDAIANPQNYERDFACDIKRGMWRAYGEDFNDPGCAGYKPTASARESAANQPQ